MEDIEYSYGNSPSEDKIPHEVIALCVINAVNKVTGVWGFVGGVHDVISESILGKESMSKGVEIEEKKGKIYIDVRLILFYGAIIPEVAWNIQEEVKKEVESMFEKEVGAVNIHIEGIKTKSNKDLEEGI